MSSKMGLHDLFPHGLYNATDIRSTAMPASGTAKRQAAFSVSEATVTEKKKIEMYSADYYTACAIGGWLSCGLTHMAVTPLDVVKCNMQIDPVKYKSIGSGFSTVMKEAGVSGLFRGWVPTLIGYGFQGTCKFGFYEYFKKYVSFTFVIQMFCQQRSETTSVTIPVTSLWSCSASQQVDF
jgi:solute carrier family 25 (mitochondrial phosphate transporter), member 3